MNPATTPADVGLLTASLNRQIGVLAGSYSRIGGATAALAWIFVGIEVVLFGAYLVLGLEQWQNAFHKVFKIGFWLFLMSNFEQHATAVVNSLVRLGLMVGGQEGADWHAVLDPSRLMDQGFQLVKVLLDNLPPWYQMGPTDLLGGGLAILLILAGFFALAVNAYMLVLAFYLALVVVGALLPFGMLSYTRQLADKAINSVVSVGLRLMLVAVSTALAQQVITGLKFSDEPTILETWSMVVTVGAVALSAWILPQRFADTFLSGSAALGGSDAMRPAIAAASTTAAAVSAGAGVAAAGIDKVTGVDKMMNGSNSRDSSSSGRVSQSIQPAQGSPSSGSQPAAGTGRSTSSSASGSSASGGSVSTPSTSPTTSRDPILES